MVRNSSGMANGVRVGKNRGAVEPRGCQSQAEMGVTMVDHIING